MTTKLNCPQCNATLQLGQAPSPGAQVKCPKCGQIFEAASLPVARWPLAPPPVPVASPVPVAAPLPVASRIPVDSPVPVAAPEPVAVPLFRPAPSERNRNWDDEEQRPRLKKRSANQAKSNLGLILVGTAAGVVILVFGIVIVVALMGKFKKEPSAAAPPVSQVRGANPANRGQSNGQIDEELFQQTLAKVPAWVPDAGVVKMFGDEIIVADRYGIRLPKDFAGKKNASNDGQHFSWTRSAAPAGEAPTLALGIRSSPQGSPLLELERFTIGRNLEQALPSSIRDLEFTAMEQGKISTSLALRTRFTGTSTATQRKIKGIVYFVHTRDRVVVLTAYAAPEDGDGASLVEAAALTFRKK